MQIYLDDCADDDDLVALLSQAGHTVYNPRTERTRGASDLRHLAYASAAALHFLHYACSAIATPADVFTLW
jgi:hypothetical protein